MSGPQKEGLRANLHEVRDRIVRPTDEQIIQRFLDRGLRHVVSVPCSITSTIQHRWEQMAEEGDLTLVNTTNEHNLVGIASGIHLATGEIPLAHMQNSGLTNAGDGFISFAGIYKIPLVAIVTWRGNNPEDDSEPHQAIGRITEKLTDAIIPGEAYGARLGRGILDKIDSAIDDAQAGGIAVVRLSPQAFDKVIVPQLPEHNDVYIAGQFERNQAMIDQKIADSLLQPDAEPITRDEAIERIVENHPHAAVLFSNGYTARAARATVFSEGHLYNTGYMGGTLAIGWGMAKSNPDIQVVVVDGDQNAQMSHMKDHLEYDYPENLTWYILNNRIGASVGVASSVPLGPSYKRLARVVSTIPDEPNTFRHPRVKDEAHNAENFKLWVAQRTAAAKKTTQTRQFSTSLGL